MEKFILERCQLMQDGTWASIEDYDDICPDEYTLEEAFKEAAASLDSLSDWKCALAVRLYDETGEVRYIVTNKYLMQNDKR